jgi:thiol-disulfide isomerase/thioredoxin
MDVKNKILFSVFIILSTNILLTKNNLFNKIKDETQLKKNEILVIVYLYPGSCSKCYMEPIKLVEYMEANKDKLSFKYIALVKCDREVELNTYRKNTGWKYYLFLDDGDSRKNLKSSPNSLMSFFDFRGKLLLDVKSGSYKANTNKIRKSMNFWLSNYQNKL